MGSYNVEEIIGLRLDSEIVCAECWSDEEWDQMIEDEVITEEETGGDFIHFCDRCQRRI